MNVSKNYKVCLMGPTQVGKTRLVYKCMNNTLSSSHHYLPTLGVEVHPYSFQRNGRTICVTIWDMAGDSRFRGLGDGYLIKADVCVIYCPTHLQANQLSYWTSMANRQGISYVVVTDDNEAIRTIQNNNFV